jgi:ATP synthase F1 complex assembly factor 1
MSSLRALRPLLRPALPGPSVLRTALAAARPLSTSLVRRDVLEELDAQLNPREIIERKRRAFEEKYGDKLKERVQA